MYDIFHVPGIIAPAGKLRPDKFDTASLSARDRQGAEIRAHVNGPSDTAYLSADAEARASDLTDLWLDPKIDLLLAVRGGFGSAHLLPLLDWRMLKNRPELPLAGFSDITALHWAMEKAGAGRRSPGRCSASWRKAPRRLIRRSFTPSPSGPRV